MDFDENIERVYYSTIKFSSNNEHSEIQVLQMLEEAGYTNKTWGINTSGRGKYVEVKFNNKRDCDSLIQSGIFDSEFNETYTVEPAFEANKTQITVFNVPLGASGTAVQV